MTAVLLHARHKISLVASRRQGVGTGRSAASATALPFFFFLSIFEDFSCCLPTTELRLTERTRRWHFAFASASGPQLPAQAVALQEDRDVMTFLSHGSAFLRLCGGLRCYERSLVPWWNAKATAATASSTGGSTLPLADQVHARFRRCVKDACDNHLVNLVGRYRELESECHELLRLGEATARLPIERLLRVALTWKVSNDLERRLWQLGELNPKVSRFQCFSVRN
jgi:hypothetical protein